MKKEYLKKGFYKERTASLNSAEIIVPLIMNLVSPKSVLDIGCGTGEFLSVFTKNGVKSVLGIDGDWIDQSKLKIPKKSFKKEDLSHSVQLNKEFDLAISLEVGEHLPPSSAKNLVETLTNSSKVVFFSSAIPLQGGDKHINEQWQDYWVNLFQKKGYIPLDYIRRSLWNNKEINPWYIQNNLLFIKKEILQTNKKLKKEFNKTNLEMINVVHPRIYLPKARIYSLFKKKIPSSIQKVFSKIHPNN